jgi:hypothetical protein
MAKPSTRQLPSRLCEMPKATSSAARRSSAISRSVSEWSRGLLSVRPSWHCRARAGCHRHFRHQYALSGRLAPFHFGFPAAGPYRTHRPFALRDIPRYSSTLAGSSCPRAGGRGTGSGGGLFSTSEGPTHWMRWSMKPWRTADGRNRWRAAVQRSNNGPGRGKARSRRKRGEIPRHIRECGSWYRTPRPRPQMAQSQRGAVPHSRLHGR